MGVEALDEFPGELGGVLECLRDNPGGQRAPITIEPESFAIFVGHDQAQIVSVARGCRTSGIVPRNRKRM